MRKTPIKKIRKKFITAILLASLTASMLTGCSSGAKYTETNGAEMGMAPTAAPAMDESSNLSALSSNSQAPQAQVLPENRKLIRNVSLDVETTEFDGLIAQMTEHINGLGGYIEQSSISGSSISGSSSNLRYAYLTARVPSDQLDQFIITVESSSNITNKSEQITDVTLQYSDVESRKKTLLIEQDRLWALLEKADTTESIIALEERLSKIRYELESYESQLRLYDNQVDYSTVNLSISEVKVFTPTVPETIGTRIQKGFARSLVNVSNGLVNLFVWTISNSPLLVLIAVIAIVVVLVLKKLDKLSQRKPKKTNPKLSQSQVPEHTDTPKQQDPPQ